jgi:hypothetical protein
VQVLQSNWPGSGKLLSRNYALFVILVVFQQRLVT